MKDWFALMNLGYSVCATGNSDSHGHNHDVGYQRNFLRVGKEDPAQLAAGDYLQAVLDERCVVSNGPFIQVWSGSDEVMGHMELVDAPDGEAVLHVMVSAATWIDVSSLEVYANGRPLVLEAMGDDLAQVAGPMDADALSWPIASPGDEVIRLDADIHLFPDQDTWYVFLVRGEGSLSPVGSGAPFAYTNAVYVDVDGDGFDAPGVGG